MFEKFYGKKILDVAAFGIDEFDFTLNGGDFGTSVGETGYAVLKFENGDLYLSIDGLTTEKPVRDGVHELPTGDFKDIVGETLTSITKEGDGIDGHYMIQFEDCIPLIGRWEDDRGLCDRRYFSLDIYGVWD